MKKRMFIGIGIAVFITVFWLGIQTSRAGYETAEYEVVETDGKFQIRKYPQLTTVSTPSNTTKGQRNSGFGRLFKFISGENEADQKIAMTTPVFMPSDAEGEAKSMQFVVPKDVAASGVPTPKGKDVKVVKVLGATFVVLKFSGTNTKAKNQKALGKLRALVKEKKLKTVGNPTFAYFDPPWTPGPLRRNEVMLKLK
jgi:hypothetical protein